MAMLRTVFFSPVDPLMPSLCNAQTALTVIAEHINRGIGKGRAREVRISLKPWMRDWVLSRGIQNALYRATERAGWLQCIVSPDGKRVRLISFSRSVRYYLGE